MECPTVVQKTLKGLNYLNSLSYSLGGAYDVTNISKILTYLGRPQDKLKTIHIAGTNGKGSVSCMTSAILGQAGYKVGLNISPHLKRLNERIIIDGNEVDDEEFDWAGRILEAATQETKILISHHEALTAAAFLIFEKNKVDYAVIEVGLGGTKDATNVITRPEIAVIVTIDFDHTHILGNSLREIAEAKAGIIKKDTNVVLGNLPKEAFEVIYEIAKLNNTRTNLQPNNYSYKTLDFSRFIYQDIDNNKEIEIKPSLKGIHQHHNSSVAIRTCTELGIGLEICKKGVENAFWPARIEEVESIKSKNGAKVVFDCAHNPAGIYTVTRYLESELKSKVQLVFGVLQTKDWQKMIDTLMPFAEELILLKPKTDRALPLDELEKYIKSKNYQVAYIGEDYDYVESLVVNSKSNTLITGSMYMVGSLRDNLIKEMPTYWTKIA